MGIPMSIGGPLPGFNININFNFNANVAPVQQVIPVPAAVWLFGSGLLGLFGVACR
jgi:hypothetical protein